MGGCCAPQDEKRQPNNNGSASVTTTSIANEKKSSSPRQQQLTSHKALSSGEQKDHTRRQSSTRGMTRLAMKFPHIRKSFRSCKKVFDECAGERNHITVPEVRPLLIQLGAKSSMLTETEIDRIIHTSDLSNDNCLDFREFLIAAAVGCFLHPHTEDQMSPEFVGNRMGFAVAREAFETIDEDNSGEIDFQELKDAFIAMKHGSQDQLIQTRLAELDFNGDKAIEFPEFVWGITAWVGMDSDDEDDEEYFVDDNTTKNANNAPTPQQRLSQDYTKDNILPMAVDNP